MDNASRAFMIAGEMLIAMLVVGLIVSVVSKFGKFSSNMNSKMQKNKQEEFNNHFFAFQGRIDISADEIVGLINYVKECNEKSELLLENGTDVKNMPDFVSVDISGVEFFTNDLFSYKREVCEQRYTDKLRSFITVHNTEYYSCNAGIKAVTDEGVVTTMVNTNEHDIEITSEDNGRKGYVKSINFKPTKIKTIPLTIFNRSEYVIN